MRSENKFQEKRQLDSSSRYKEKNLCPNKNEVFHKKGTLKSMKSIKTPNKVDKTDKSDSMIKKTFKDQNKIVDSNSNNNNTNSNNKDNSPIIFNMNTYNNNAKENNIILGSLNNINNNAKSLKEFVLLKPIKETIDEQKESKTTSLKKQINKQKSLEEKLCENGSSIINSFNENIPYNPMSHNPLIFNKSMRSISVNSSNKEIASEGVKDMERVKLKNVTNNTVSDSNESKINDSHQIFGSSEDDSVSDKNYNNQYNPTNKLLLHKKFVKFFKSGRSENKKISDKVSVANSNTNNINNIHNPNYKGLKSVKSMKSIKSNHNYNQQHEVIIINNHKTPEQPNLLLKQKTLNKEKLPLFDESNSKNFEENKNKIVSITPNKEQNRNKSSTPNNVNNNLASNKINNIQVNIYKNPMKNNENKLDGNFSLKQMTNHSVKYKRKKILGCIPRCF